MPVNALSPVRLALGLVMLALLCALFHRPLGKLLKLGARTLAALGGLALWKLVGAGAGVALGVNVWNALVLAVLGLPGFGLLMMLQWVSGL